MPVAALLSVPVLTVVMLGGASGAARIAVPARLTALLLAVLAVAFVIRPDMAAAAARAGHGTAARGGARWVHLVRHDGPLLMG